MKKIAFMFVAAAAMTFAACTENKPAAEAPAVEEAVEEVVDSAAAAVEEVADSAAAAVEEVADSAATAVEEAAE